MWSDYQKLNQEERETFLCELKEFLLNSSNPIPQFVIKKKQPKIRIKKQQPKKVVIKQEDPRKKEALKLLSYGKSYCEVAREFKVSDNAIRNG
jgi:DNA-binding NarL/FixJ family response regulator